MSHGWTVESLIAFETQVAEAFNEGQIRAPVHLSDGNEAALLEIFEEVRPQDYVFCSWRSHYQALLHGVPADAVLSEIMAGRSISLCFPEHHFYSSAIVGGILPIAVGTALGVRRSGSDSRVWCFIGDMTAEMGMASTSIRYSQNFDLPVTFVVEDNGISVCTDTKATWGIHESSFANETHANVRYFPYISRYPHAGAGVRVQF